VIRSVVSAINAVNISSIDPSFGSALGGTLVTVHGHGFDSLSHCVFGASAAANTLVVNSSMLICKTPRLSLSKVALIIACASGAPTSAPVAFQIFSGDSALQLFPTQGFSQGGVLVRIEISNLAEIPATAKEYSCIFKVSPTAVVSVTAARDDRVFSCIQPGLPTGHGELQIFAEQMQVGPGVAYSVLKTIQLRKVSPSQIFANTSETVELVME
jgi:hypothetical protein